MNIRASILLAGCWLLFVGCQREAAMPGDSFHLTVQHIITDPDVVVSLLKIHIPHDAGIYIDADGGHLEVALLPDLPGGAVKDGKVALSASRITRTGDDFAYIQTLIRAESNHGSSSYGSAGGPSVYPVRATAKLDSFFSISATDGDYQLRTPVEIGRLNGKPMMLIVGAPPK